MLMNKKHLVAQILAKREGSDTEMPEPSHEIDPAWEAAAEELLRAVHENSSKKLALAFKNLFQIADVEPHEEGPHIQHGDE